MRRDFICALSWWENNVLVSRALKGPTPRRSQWSNCRRTVYWTRWGWRGASAGVSLWMDSKSADSLRHTGVAAAPAGNLYLPENFLFANEWLASHSYPPRGDGVGRPSIYSGSKHKNITDGVTVAPFDWGHEGIFLALSASCMKNTFGPTSEKITLCKVVCFVRVRLLLRHGNPSERQVIWLCRGRLCTRWQPCSVTVFSLCVSVHTCRRKTKKAFCVCVVLVCIPGETTVGSNLLWIWRKTDSTAPEEIKISGAIISLYCAFTLEHSQSYSVISFVVGRAGHKALAGSRVYLTYIKCKRL